MRPSKITLSLAAILLATSSVLAETPPAPAKTPGEVSTTATPQAMPSLKSSVTLLNALPNNEVAAMVAPSGPLRRGLAFQVNGALKDVAATVIVTDVESTSAPADVVATSLSYGTSKVVSNTPLAITLNQGTILPMVIAGNSLRPATTYKGWVVMASGTDQQRWEITITSGGLGVITADQIAPLQFVSWPFCMERIGEFGFTLRDKSGLGPYQHVRVYADAFTAPSTKDVKSNVTLDNFAFDPDGNTEFVEQLAFKNDTSPATLTKQLNVKARIRGLQPGEYTGGLRFAAANAAEDSADARLPLTIHVRHHWILPVLWIVFGSALGWYGTKYVVAARKARELSRKASGLRERSDFLARRSPPRSGWTFSRESSSYALTKVRVQLSQLTQRAAAIPMMVAESEILEQHRDVEVRIAKLEMWSEKRTHVESVADGRPAAQLALGRLLRRALSILEQPTLADAQQTEFAALLRTADGWLAADTLVPQYRLALQTRRQSQAVPTAAVIGGIAAGVIKDELQRLLAACPSDAAIASATDIPALQSADRQIAALALLWRERNTAWGADLASQSATDPHIEQLFDLVDTKFWESLESIRNTFTITRDTTSTEKIEAPDVVEFFLQSADEKIKSRILHHPLQVVWRITLPDGNVRTVETEGTTLVQYFAEAGTVRVSAALRWRSTEIAVPAELQVDAVDTGEYGVGRLVTSGGALEATTFSLAILFAIVTAMSTQYDSTFGSFNQYLALFLWAAGAGSGGNVFKQLGTGNVVGGSSDATLPART